MTPTDFWYKLVDMTQSNTTVFSVGGLAITEKQLLWVVGISALIIVVLLVRFAIMWILGASPKTKSEKNATTSPSAVPPLAPAPNQPVGEIPLAGSPQELLADTSDRKRSLHDYVTPDTIHADVMKQTLNNDFPYNTLKPDPTKITGATATPMVSTPTFGTPAPVLPPITSAPATPVQTTVQPQVQTILPPLPTISSTPSTTAQPPVQVTTPTIQTPVPQMPIQPAPTVAAAPVLPTEVRPVEQPVSILPPLPTAQPQATPEAPVAINTPTVVPQVSIPTLPTVVTPVAPDLTVKQAEPTATSNVNASSVLPPLPPKEPAAQMVVGVADNTVTPITKNGFNPTDPIIP